MKLWLAQHRSAAALALTRLGATPVATALAIGAIAIALALPALGVVLLKEGSQWLAQVAPRPQISAYMPLTAELATAHKVEKRLRAIPGVRQVEFVSREATLARFRSREGLREVVDVLPKNPFPHAFIVTPADAAPAALDALGAELKAWPEVEHVQLDSDWVRRLDALFRLGRGAVGVLAVLLGAGLLGVTFNVTRLQVLTRREEIELSWLLGASADYVRRPFLYYAGCLGLVGGLLASALLAAGCAWLAQPIAELAALYGFSWRLTGPGLVEALAVTLAALALCLAGTLSALRRFSPNWL